ncbi:hypothetical protein ACFYPG_00595 [Micromonospora sp. NPDC005553]|uniref:hypothetical protein n=1 Tax=Micromonospora sp. NPDC005553 TaxID=3364232 RepID=UPI003685E6E7
MYLNTGRGDLAPQNSFPSAEPAPAAPLPGLTHLAAGGRSAAELRAQSRRRHLAALGIYIRLGEETSARITAENDEHHQRHFR